MQSIGELRKMVSRNQSLVVAFIACIIILFILLMIQACEGTPTSSGVPALSCTTYDAYDEWVSQGEVATTRYYVQDQIIVSGPSKSVVDVVDIVDPNNEQLEILRTCQVNYEPSEKDNTGDLPFPLDVLGDLTTSLYGVIGDVSVEDIVEAISSEGDELNVVADPNYLTGLLGQSTCGNPYEFGASPYEFGASPYEFGASPYEFGASPAGDSVTSAEGLFWSQWAFKDIGVSAPGSGVSTIATGDDIRVAVFDTSPFTQTLMPGTTGTETITSVTPNLQLTLSQPALLSLVPAVPEAAGNISDHGLYVSGLVHAVAPDSDIHLVRVLNDYGCGDLYTLIWSIYQFTWEVEGDKGSLDGAVINLSLGVLSPSAVGSQPRPVRVLEAAVLYAEDHDVVVVAAAGNDSYPVGTQLPAHLPAVFSSVIGVAASNISQQQSCFSNKGDLSAPGGDGITIAGVGDCVPAFDSCTDPCDHAIISLALSSPTGYSYWSGTSFSTPLVSGLASLVMESGASPGVWMDPAVVRAVIACDAPNPDSVIDASATLTTCMP